MASLRVGPLSVGVWALYAVACVVPAIKVDEGGHACTALRLGTLPGWETLLLGWVPPFTVPWLANPLLLIGWVLLLRRRYLGAFLFGGAAALAGLTIVAFWSMEGWQTFQVGYYLWQASLILFAWGAWQLRRRSMTSKPGAPAPDDLA